MQARDGSATLQLDVPLDLLDSAHMTLDDVRLELAILLFQKGGISLGRAAAYAGVGTGELLSRLAGRNSGPAFDANEALADAAMLAGLRQRR